MSVGLSVLICQMGMDFRAERRAERDAPEELEAVPGTASGVNKGQIPSSCSHRQRCRGAGGPASSGGRKVPGATDVHSLQPAYVRHSLLHETDTM